MIPALAWFLGNLALPLSIAAVAVMWWTCPQCCLLRQVWGWIQPRSRTPDGSLQTPDAGAPHIPPDDRPEYEHRSLPPHAPLATPTGAALQPPAGRTRRAPNLAVGDRAPDLSPTTRPAPMGTGASRTRMYTGPTPVGGGTEPPRPRPHPPGHTKRG